MATFRLKLAGEPPGISFKSFLQACNSSLKVIDELDSAISGGSGMLEWVVSDLSIGSLVVEAESHSRVKGRDTGPEVVRAFMSGLRQIEEEGTTPTYFSETGLRHARRLMTVIGHNGTRGILISNSEETVALTASASVNVEQLLKIRHRTIGSVEGKLETISVHGSKPKFLIYQSSNKKAVMCLFEPELLESAKTALGQRVLAAGVVLYNVKGEPVRVVVERIRILRHGTELPSISDVTGSDPDFTGGLESVEYLRKMRGA